MTKMGSKFKSLSACFAYFVISALCLAFSSMFTYDDNGDNDNNGTYIGVEIGLELQKSKLLHYSLRNY